MSTNAILTGLGLVIVLAIASQLVAGRLRVAAIVLLLPVGFAAGAATDDVQPANLFGDTFQPLVSIGVGLILFEAGLRLRLRELEGGIRGVVLRLITVGTIVTAIGVTLAVKLVFGLSWGVSGMLGAILVVSGPTVVLPLLAVVRPSDTVRSVLKWEGTLIDPIGALLGVVAFQALQNGAAGDSPFQPGAMALSLGVGLAVGLAGAGLLAMLLQRIQRTSPGQGVAAGLMVLTAAVVCADLLREDSGFVAAAAMGMVLANQGRLDVSRILQFDETIVTLLIGMLFVLISASVTPSQVDGVLWRGLALVAIMVLVIRPLAVAIGTWRSDLGWRERAFVAWMAPRGIVAAATGSAFGLELSQSGIAGADKILPIAFVAIFGTVVLYGLTASPAARLLGVAGAGEPLVLMVGGQPWALAIAQALEAAGMRVLMWISNPDDRAAAHKAGLDAGMVPVGVEAASQLEEVSDALLLTESDDFNALAGYELRLELGSDRVHRLAFREGGLDPTPSYAEGGVLFADGLTFPELSRMFEAGARLVDVPSDRRSTLNGLTPLFIVTEDGRLWVVRAGGDDRAGHGDKTICLAE